MGTDLVRVSKPELSTVAKSTTEDTTNTTTTPSPSCNKCGDTGFLISKAGAQRCACMIEKSIVGALQSSSRYREARLSDFSRTLCDDVLAWASHPSDGLFVTGPTGTGKTHLGAALVRAWFESGKRAMFQRSADLYLGIRQTYHTELGEQTLLTVYSSTPLLVLDDFASGSLSDHERRVALEVLDRRMNDLKPTVVTSNWPIQQISDRMDERIGSRLSAFRVIVLKSDDRRQVRVP
jgi:Cdc6-like AAA superfamily ATPase